MNNIYEKRDHVPRVFEKKKLQVNRAIEYKSVYEEVLETNVRMKSKKNCHTYYIIL